jgi:hypothetical protein
MADSNPKQAGNPQPEIATSPWTEPFQRAQANSGTAARPEEGSNSTAPTQPEADQRKADSARATQEALSVIFNHA